MQRWHFRDLYGGRELQTSCKHRNAANSQNKTEVHQAPRGHQTEGATKPLRDRFLFKPREGCVSLCSFWWRWKKLNKREHFPSSNTAHARVLTIVSLFFENRFLVRTLATASETQKHVLTRNVTKDPICQNDAAASLCRCRFFLWYQSSEIWTVQ